MLRDVVKYSEGFKRQVVSDVESGRFRSCTEASAAHGIKGKTTVRRWLREYGKDHLSGKVIWVSKEGEPRELQRLRERVRQLEGALSDAHLELSLIRSQFEQLCEVSGTDGAAFKKKHDVRPSGERRSF